MKLPNLRAKLDKKIVQYRIVRSRIQEEKSCLKTVREKLRLMEEAQQVLQALIQSIQASAHGQIAAVVTECLTTIFDDPYSFSIEFERKRGKTAARMVFSRDGLRVAKPSRSIGCGVIDVAAFALRLAAILLAYPTKRRILILDEPFRFLHSHKYRQRLRQLLVTLAERFRFQFIIVTQLEELEVGKVVYF